MEKEIKEIRDMEKQVANDIKSTNLLLDIKAKLNSSSAARDVRMASLHALRRLFVQFLETSRLRLAEQSASDSSSSASNREAHEKLREYKLWLLRQYASYKDDLCSLILSGDDALIAPAIRTLMEVKNSVLSHARSHINVLIKSFATPCPLLTTHLVCETRLFAKEKPK